MGDRLKFLSLAFGVSIGVAVFLVFQWHAYVTRAPSPYDQTGMSLNALMPAPLNAWGCRRLKQRFAAAAPPDGCIAGDGGWR